jgi:hypothetical protein
MSNMPESGLVKTKPIPPPTAGLGPVFEAFSSGKYAKTG